MKFSIHFRKIFPKRFRETIGGNVRAFARKDAGAVTVDWVVLSAAVVGLLAAGYGYLRSGTLDLADGTESYLGATGPRDF